MADSFARHPVSLESPGREFFAITPGPDEIPTRPRALWIGVAGNLVCTDGTGATTTFTGLGVGWHPIGPVRILAGTTAGGIIGID